MRSLLSTISAGLIIASSTLSSNAEKRQSELPRTRLGIGSSHECGKFIAHGIRVGPYIDEIRRKIYSDWDSATHRDRRPIVISFSINADGSIGEVTVEQSAALSRETALAVKTISAAGPFAPLPRGLNGPLKLSLPFNVNKEEIAQLTALNKQAATLAEPIMNHVRSGDLPSKITAADLDACRRAQQIYEQALALSQKAYGLSFPQTSFELNKLVPLYKQTHEWDKAIHAVDHLLLYYRMHQSFENAKAIARCLWDLGDIYAGKGDTKKAGSLYEESLSFSETHQLRRDLVCPTLYQNKLGDFYVNTGQFAKVELAYKDAVAHIRWDSRFGMENSYSGIDSLDKLARFYFDRGRFDESEKLYKQELAVYESFKKPFGFTSDFEWFAPYIEMLRKQGRDAEAEEIKRKVLAVKISSGSFKSDGSPLWERN
jgi:tetratricopeptide (TPR) repeat protein